MENPNVHDFIEEFRLLLSDRMIADLENGQTTPHSANIEMNCAAILYPASLLNTKIKYGVVWVLDVRGKMRKFRIDRNGWLLSDITVPEYGRWDFENDYMIYRFMCFHYPHLSGLPFVGFSSNIFKSTLKGYLFGWEDVLNRNCLSTHKGKSIEEFCSLLKPLKENDIDCDGDLRENFDYFFRQKIGKGFLKRKGMNTKPFIIDVVDYLKNNLE